MGQARTDGRGSGQRGEGETMINIYNVRLDESTVEGLELIKRKEHLDTVDDVIRFFIRDYAAYNQDEELQNLMEVEE